MGERISIAELRAEIEHPQGPDVMRAELLALVEAVEAAQQFADVWRGAAVGRDTFGVGLTELRARLDAFSFGDTEDHVATGPPPGKDDEQTIS